MNCYKLGPRAYRVTKKYELVTITSPLFDMDFLKVDFKVAGLPVTGMALRQVGADMDMNRIETYIDPDLHDQGATDTCGEPTGTIRVMFGASNVAPFDIAAQALIVHEGVHASLRRSKLASAGNLEEAAAYLAQALFFELKGESILQAWIDDNQWIFEQKHLDDPLKENTKAQIYVAAEKVIERFDLDSHPASLSGSDVSELVAAIASDPGYRAPAKPREPKSRPREKTLRERILERREKRRARWRAAH